MQYEAGEPFNPEDPTAPGFLNHNEGYPGNSILILSNGTLAVCLAHANAPGDPPNDAPPPADGIGPVHRRVGRRDRQEPDPLDWATAENFRYTPRCGAGPPQPPVGSARWITTGPLRLDVNPPGVEGAPVWFPSLRSPPGPPPGASPRRRRFLAWGAGGLLWPALAGVTLSSEPAAEDDTRRFYEARTIQTIRLEIRPGDLDRMRSALPRRVYVPATFAWNDQVLAEVGVRYKGNSSSQPDSTHKRSFLVRFPHFRKGQHFLGLRHVALDSGVQFGSLFSERLITDALRGVGVKASRCNYARVYLNGTFMGVYVNVERIDEAFVRRHFGTDQGVLFKVDEAGPGTDLRYVGGDPAIYRSHFELDLGDDAGAFVALIDLLRALGGAGDPPVDIQRCLDLEPFLKTIAVLLFAGAFDQYTGWAPHNFYLYRNPADRRWTYIPWDLDVGFAVRAFGQVPVLDGWHAAWPTPVPGRPVMERIVADPPLLERYRRLADDILETWFRPDRLIPRLRSLYAQIRLDLEQDPFPARRITVPSDSDYDSILTSMEDFIRRRYTLARAQLDSPGMRPRPVPMASGPRPDGPQPGPPSADAPGGLRAARVTSDRVELQWTDHAQGEVAFVVQRCTGAECTDFANAIGEPGSDLAGAVDRSVQPGVTYRYRVYAVLPTPQGPRGTGPSAPITVTVPTGRDP